MYSSRNSSSLLCFTMRFILTFTLTINSSCSIMNSGFRTKPGVTQPSPNYLQTSNLQVFHDMDKNEIETLKESITKNVGSSNTIKIEQITSKNLTGRVDERLYFLVRNDGKKDEYIRINVSGDEKGYYAKEIPPTETDGSTKGILVRMDYNLDNIPSTNPDLITIQARGKRNTLTVKRSSYYPGNDYDSQFGQQNSPFCYDRYVTGNCRYRTDPEYCLQYEWTAYAIVQNLGGLQTLRSIPPGLFVPGSTYPGPGTKERVRVWVKTSCCTPFVQIISSDPIFPNVENACVVDVRELQGLHPGEIAGIVTGSVFILIIIIICIILIIRRRRARTILVGHSSRSRECVSRE